MRLGENSSYFISSPKQKSLPSQNQYPLLSKPPQIPPPTHLTHNSRSFFPTRAAQNLPKHSSRAQPAHSLACSFRTRLHSLSADLLNITDSFIPESLCGQLAVKATGCLVRGSFEFPTVTGRLPADFQEHSIALPTKGSPRHLTSSYLLLILILCIHSISSLLSTDLYT